MEQASVVENLIFVVAENFFGHTECFRRLNIGFSSYPGFLTTAPLNKGTAR